MNAARQGLALVLFAVAMAWVEAAVVLDLRTLVDRIQPHQAGPLPMVGNLERCEIIREAATLIMLLTVGWLAGQTCRSRFGFALVAFGIWDIFYYAFLKVLTGWPHSLFDWDILFLIPLPWWGPVWAPLSIAALMIVFGAVVAGCDSDVKPIWPGRATTGSAVAGTLLALYVFMADALRAISAGAGPSQLRELLPVWFNWPLFLVALLLLAVPVLEVIRCAWPRKSVGVLQTVPG